MFLETMPLKLSTRMSTLMFSFYLLLHVTSIMLCVLFGETITLCVLKIVLHSLFICEFGPIC